MNDCQLVNNDEIRKWLTMIIVKIKFNQKTTVDLG